MSDVEKNLSSLKNAVEYGVVSEAERIVKALVDDQVDLEIILDKGLIAGMNAVAKKFETLEVFLPELIFSTDAMHAGIEIIKKHIKGGQEAKRFNKGTVVIGTMKGDIHDVGKTIVASLMTANGFKVHDLGIDVPSENFVHRAEELNADIIALSCLMTTALSRQKEVMEDLNRLGLRGRFRVIVGGGAVSEGWAEEIGADGYGKDAPEAVNIALSLVPKAVDR